jgi:acetyltransferase-like isoleucine patch superfamily enzyme
MTNRERRDKGLPYITDAEILAEQKAARAILAKYNRIKPLDFKKANKILNKFFGKKGEHAYIEPPFFCDYGKHIEVGENFYANSNFVVLDTGKVQIGKNALIGPNVSIFTAGHPVHYKARNSGYEYGINVKIGDNVWIGGGTVINPGVKIGNNVVIGSGSVVVRDIPSNSLAAGNPCKVSRQIADEEINYYYKYLLFSEDEMKRVNASESFVPFTASQESGGGGSRTVGAPDVKK